MSEVIEAPSTKREVILNPQDIGLSQHRRQDWVAVAKEGTAVDDLLKPVYWSHMAARLQPFDRVEVRDEGGRWVVELMVLRAERNWASVTLLFHHDLPKLRASSDVDTIDDYDVEWGGPHDKWRVTRKSDKHKMQTKFASQEEGLAWLRQFEATQRR